MNRDDLFVERWHRHGPAVVRELGFGDPIRAEVRRARKVDAVLAEHRREP